VDAEFFALGVLWYVVFLLSSTVHEASHALAAKLGGDTTAADGGQVSLNPVPHIRREMWGMVLIPVLSFFLFDGGWMIGWASAPYDLRWRMRYPHRAGWMALAGPGSNLALALLAAAGIAIGFASGDFSPGIHLDGAGYAQIAVAQEGSAFVGLATFLSIAFSLNVILFTFNLIPVPPLDGATAVSLLMPPDVARRWTVATQNPTFHMIAFLVAWFVFPSLILRPVFVGALSALYSLA
jgi:Zn-dependent protease